MKACTNCREARYHETCELVSISNMVIDPRGRLYKRPVSRLRLAWLVLRGWRVYFD